MDEIVCQVFAVDTDYGGIVHHASYWRYLEQARTAWVAARDPSMLQQPISQFLVVAHLEASYLKPARLHQQLRVSTLAHLLRPTQLCFVQKICDEITGQKLFEAKVTMVCVNANMQPQAIPLSLTNC